MSRAVRALAFGELGGLRANGIAVKILAVLEELPKAALMELSMWKGSVMVLPPTGRSVSWLRVPLRLYVPC